MNRGENKQGINEVIQENLLKMLEGTYSSAATIINGLVPHKIRMDEPLLPIDAIDNVLIHHFKAVTAILIYDNSFTEFNLNIAIDLQSDYYKDSFITVTPKIAYGILMMTGSYILQHLAVHINKEFIYTYIRENIVRPRLLEELEHHRAMYLSVNRSKQEEELMKDIDQDMKSLVYHFMITHDNAQIQSLISKYSQLTAIHKDGMIHALDSINDLFIPSFIYQILFRTASPDEFNKAMHDFSIEYQTTLTYDALLQLFKRYTDKHIDLVNKTRRTFETRLDFHSLNNLQLVDGLTMTEVRIVNKLLDSISLSDHETLIYEKSPMLKSISVVVNKYKTIGTKATIDNNNITIYNLSNKSAVGVYPYRKPTIVNDINDIFTIFGTSKDNVKNQWRGNRSKSCLVQSGFTKSEVNEAFINNRDLKKSFKDQDYNVSVEHRNRQIDTLLSTNQDQSLAKEISELLLGNGDSIKYVNPFQSLPYVSEDPIHLLRILAETEGIYRKVIK